jgi:cytosine/creatinine deaminase
MPEVEDRRTRIHRRRHLISEVLVAALVAVAYEGPVGVVHAALRSEGVSISSLALFVVFFLTVLRFFIGDILHLDEDELSEPRDDFADKGAEARWFLDLGVIVLEFVILIFLGHLASLKESQHRPVSFYALFTVLMAVDVLWIFAMGVMSWLTKRYHSHMLWGLWERGKVPWGWAVLNAAMLAITWIWYARGSHYSTKDLSIFTSINAVAFVVDVVILNYYMGRHAMEGDIVDTVQLRDAGMTAALQQARASESEHGIPIGAALLDGDGNVIGAGHNQRVQLGNQVLHAEIDCLANVGRRTSYADTTLYSTLMPCYMCAGAIIQFKIPRVVVGESKNFEGAADLLKAHGVQVTDVEDEECVAMMRNFIANRSDVWAEDIGTSEAVT